MAANGDSHNELRREIDDLGRMFGATITQFAGDAGLDLVEQVRGLARSMREGNDQASESLKSLLAELSEEQLKIVIRSFSIFLELANLAEDRQRIRTLQQREEASFPEPRKESIRDAIAAFKSRGLTASEVQTLVNKVAIELVLTAHPTEAKRRSVRRILRRIHKILADRDAEQGRVRHQGRISRELQSEMEMLWQTDFIRPRRPTVLDEVARGLAFLPVLWEEAPALIDELRQALAENFPGVKLQHDPPLIRYGSWMGGDRDGNPFVTPDITRQTLERLRKTAVDLHLETCSRLSKFLSISDRETPPPPALTEAIRQVGATYPELAEELKAQRPLESYRQWLHAIEWRLLRTAEVSLASEQTQLPVGAYASADELWADVDVVAKALNATRNANTELVEVQPWLDQILLFGFHTERLDVRQHSGVYRGVIDELWQAMGVVQAGETLDEAARCDRLLQTIGRSIPAPSGEWSPATAETLELFALLRRVGRRFGMNALGGHVVSMTEYASDMLTVLWLWRASETVDGGHRGDAQLLLPIVPLFETIDDLKGGAATFRSMLEKPAYREHLRGLKDQQMIMIGYSDSTKDGGYVAAQWALFQAQIELQQIADEFGVTLTFFHGRGGALGRGGGPAARSILSLPTEAFSGSLRLTEQGEVLAERYDNPYIAHRHLEQVAWSTLTAVSRRAQAPAEWQTAMDQLGAESLAAYRRFVDHPAFGEYYRAATPINAIEKLPIGSRPSKRKAGGRIEDLRAIPWVFSWTQNRCIIPAWFGIGSACEALIADEPAMAGVLANMYRKWSFFTAMIDNASLALAKANMTVFQQYAQLAENIDGARELTQTIVAEYDRSRRAILTITGSRELLDEVPWLQRSINVRNGYVDPLNMIQVELLQRSRAAEPSPELEHLTNLTVKGLSTGMRTTG